MENITKGWNKYNAIKTYNSNFKKTKDYYETIKMCYAFYNGDQWLGENNKKLPQPVFNIEKRVVDFKIASLTSDNVAINVETLEYVASPNGEVTDTDFINAEIENILEKVKFQDKRKKILLNGAVTGDMCFHWIFDAKAKTYRKSNTVIGAITCEIIDATNVGFGNANISDVQKQPWIIIIGRDTVKNLQNEAKEFKKNVEIESDYSTDYQVSEFAETEVGISGDNEGKALYVYVYEKRYDKRNDTEKVYVSKYTQEAVIFENIDTEYSYYPVAFSNWYSQNNTYHGRGEVEGLSANQILINKLVAMIAYHQQLTSFPPTLYNKKKISSLSNIIGGAYGIDLDESKGESLNNIIKNIEPVNMSDYIIKTLDLIMQYTKECMGVSDASLGNIDPKNTSAIIAVQKSNSIPLENVKDNLYDLVEQCVIIILDMMGTKYGTRPVLITDKKGNKQLIDYDFNNLKGIDLTLNIDIGSGSYYSELATMQTLDNLLQGQYMEFIDYLERMPNNMIPKKEELISNIKEKMGQLQPGQAEKYEQMAQFMESLPIEEQQRLKSLPDAQLEQELLAMMGGTQ